MGGCCAAVPLGPSATDVAAHTHRNADGINMPLAFTGQEWVWARTFAKFGVNRTDMNEFFAGPAFLAWGRMGNIRGWGGPMTDAWMEGQHQLQLKILRRMNLLGMTPVLPAFAGFVPKAMLKLFPGAKFSRSAQWVSFQHMQKVAARRPLILVCLFRAIFRNSTAASISWSRVSHSLR